ncbi:hypothetical protein F5B22DRAFT_611580 [Xylaria bambusicola]|uniref:uncharacterized protein n=1 Tax=Xylaria bambusicola TaxID=326684 RepID=UPI0020077464|nr:uncharacterized protein F5B22DRAFT_611580 [Xylaria bambusicola]KAI0514434.1 hypothetical protein F5B22DRAFT_611580 [Xylaria bambusicola]
MATSPAWPSSCFELVLLCGPLGICLGGSHSSKPAYLNSFIIRWFCQTTSMLQSTENSPKTMLLTDSAVAR